MVRRTVSGAHVASVVRLVYPARVTVLQGGFKHEEMCTMTWRTIHLADAAATPWRNGGGMTRELAAWPTQDAWRWRMSVAEVTASGPFSRFEGITRWFAVLKGDGVVLNVHTPSDSADATAAEHRLTATDPALCFDGGATTHCTVMSGLPKIST